MINRTLTIYLDDLPLRSGHAVRGIGNYTRNLIAGLANNKIVKKVSLAEQPDIVHYPYFDLFYHTLPIRKKFPTIVTIHDIIPLVFSKHYPPGLKGRINYYLQRLALKTVRAVITDSECSKSDIINYLHYPPNQIFVTYLAAGEKFHQLNKDLVGEDQLRKKYNLPPSFVLYASDINWNKNVINLVLACKKAKTSLVIVGKWSQETSFDRLHPENQIWCQFVDQYWDDPTIIRLGWVDEEDFIKLYNLATVYCQPSFYEGFGIQVLEAMACGCPVVTSKTSSLPEIAGDAALLVDPYSVDEISQGITKILTNPTLRRSMIEHGFKQIKQFSWEKTINRTVEVYQSVLNSIGPQGDTLQARQGVTLGKLN